MPDSLLLRPRPTLQKFDKKIRKKQAANDLKRFSRLAKVISLHEEKVVESEARAAEQFDRDAANKCDRYARRDAGRGAI